MPPGYIAYFVLPAVMAAGLGRRLCEAYGWRRPLSLLLTGLLVDDYSGDGRPDIVCATQQGVFLFRDVAAGQIGFQRGRIDTLIPPKMTGAVMLVRYVPTQIVPHILVPTPEELLFYRWNGQTFAPQEIPHQLPALNPVLVLGRDGREHRILANGLGHFEVR